MRAYSSSLKTWTRAQVVSLASFFAVRGTAHAVDRPKSLIANVRMHPSICNKPLGRVALTWSLAEFELGKTRLPDNLQLLPFLQRQSAAADINVLVLEGFGVAYGGRLLFHTHDRKLITCLLITT